jgi:hypothetical protein
MPARRAHLSSLGSLLSGSMLVAASSSLSFRLAASRLPVRVGDVERDWLAGVPGTVAGVWIPTIASSSSSSDVVVPSSPRVGETILRGRPRWERRMGEWGESTSLRRLARVSASCKRLTEAMTELQLPNVPDEASVIALPTRPYRHAPTRTGHAHFPAAIIRPTYEPSTPSARQKVLEDLRRDRCARSPCVADLLHTLFSATTALPLRGGPSPTPEPLCQGLGDPCDRPPMLVRLLARWRR